MTSAEEYIQNDPDGVLAHLPELSAANQSEARCDRAFLDGSGVTVTSRDGESPVVTYRDAEDHELVHDAPTED